MINTTNKIVRKIVMLCNENVKYFLPTIQWPTLDTQRSTSDRIELASTMKRCIGFIDGTHIRLASSLCGERDYYNRKGFPSIQLQVVVDDRLL